MAIPRILKYYCGQKIPGLWRFSRKKAGQDGVFLDELVLPNHPLASKSADLTILNPRMVRRLLRKAVRLQVVDKETIKESTLWESHQARRYRRPWDREDIGDRYSLRNKKKIPFKILISRACFIEFHTLITSRPDKAVSKVAPENNGSAAERQDELSIPQIISIVKSLFRKLNKDFKYLSNGKFSLRLRNIEILDKLGEGLKCTDDGGFSMRIQHMEWMPRDFLAYYCQKGEFIVTPRGFFLAGRTPLSTAIIIHEMMHGLLGSVHSHDGSKIGRSYPGGERLPGSVFKLGGKIGLHPHEAKFLGWPIRPPTDTVVPLRAFESLDSSRDKP